MLNFYCHEGHKPWLQNVFFNLKTLILKRIYQNKFWNQTVYAYFTYNSGWSSSTNKNQLLMSSRAQHQHWHWATTWTDYNIKWQYS